MAITVIRTAPDESSYMPLSEYQAQTPESLTDTEVLHYSSPAEVIFTPSLASLFEFPSVVVYVTSQLFTIWSREEEKGLTIPFQNISLHAALGPGARGEGEKGCIYMQLDGATHLLSDAHADGEDEEEDEGVTELVELHITPADESTLSQFYEGLCNCASLHPDPTPADEEMFDENHEWITAETLAAGNGNGVDDDMDEEEGNVTKWRRTS